MHVKMNVIANINCYLEQSVVTLKLHKEYLNTVTYNTTILLRIKHSTVWCIECCSMSTYMGVTNFQKTVQFFGLPCIWYDTHCGHNKVCLCYTNRLKVSKENLIKLMASISCNMPVMHNDFEIFIGRK